MGVQTNPLLLGILLLPLMELKQLSYEINLVVIVLYYSIFREGLLVLLHSIELPARINHSFLKVSIGTKTLPSMTP